MHVNVYTGGVGGVAGPGKPPELALQGDFGEKTTRVKCTAPKARQEAGQHRLENMQRLIVQQTLEGWLSQFSGASAPKARIATGVNLPSRRYQGTKTMAIG